MTLGVVEQTEILPRLLDLNDIHEAGWEEHISANLVVHLDEALHHNHLALAIRQRVFEAISKQDNQGQTLTQLVRSSRWPWGKDALRLVKHPVRGRKHAL